MPDAGFGDAVPPGCNWRFASAESRRSLKARNLSQPPRTGRPMTSQPAPIDRRRLPLNSLRAFEAAARQMSFTRAAEGLGVTQSAISRHILNLEELIGARVFERRGSALALTRAGQDLLLAVIPALDGLQTGLNAVCGIDRGGTLRLALPPSFACRMAAPIIETCRAEGGVAIEIDTPYVLDSLDHTAHDAAVVFSRPRVTDQVMDLLWMEELTLLCRPDAAARVAGAGLAEALRVETVLHVRNEGGRHTAWAEFLRAAGVSRPLPQGIVFDTAHMALDFAAREGGLVVADKRLAARDLTDGRLAAPFDLSTPSGFGYFMLFRPDDLQREAVRIFRRRLLTEFAVAEPARTGWNERTEGAA
ncbi:LysR substrate-binding domain-containing protein [Stappia sp. ICDLI1TA098]